MSYTFNMVGGGGLSDSNAILTVAVPRGAEVIITKDNVTLTPTMWVQNVPSGVDKPKYLFLRPLKIDCALFVIPPSLFGEWTPSATLNGITVGGETINISTNDKYSLSFQVIPFEYQQVSYVELPSAGNVYYTLDIPFGGHYRVRTKILMEAVANGYIIFGTTEGANYYDVYVSSSTFYWGRGGAGTANASNKITAGKGSYYEIDYNQTQDGTVIINGELCNTVDSTISSSQPLTIGRRGTSEYGKYTKIFLFQTFTNHYTFKRNLIPCYRKSDNEIGFFDTISDTFFANQGTGTPRKGDEIISTKHDTNYDPCGYMFIDRFYVKDILPSSWS